MGSQTWRRCRCVAMALAVGLTSARSSSVSAQREAQGPGQANPETTRIERLVLALATSASYKVRLQAAVLLGHSGDARAGQVLTVALVNDPHYTVRAAASTGLVKLNVLEAIPLLFDRVGADPELFVREEARKALLQFDRQVALPLALKSYGSKYPGARREVITYLAISPTPAAEPVFVSALGDSLEVAAVARQALLALSYENLQRALGRAAEHPDPTIRRAAMQMIMTQPSAGAVKTALAVYDRDLEDEEVRAAAGEALRASRPFLPMSQLVRDAGPSSERHTRARALRLLGCLGGPEALTLLLAATTDGDRYVRGVAVMALGELGDPQATPTLTRLGRDPSNTAIFHLVKNALRKLQTTEDMSEP